MFEEQIGIAFLKNRLYMIIAFVVGISVGLLVSRLSPEDKVVLVPPSFNKEIVIKGSKISPAYMEEIALFLVPYISSFTPQNIDSSLDFFLQYVGPEHYEEIKSLLKTEAERAKRGDVSQAFYPKRVVITGSNTVSVEGQLRRYVGSEKTTEVGYKYDFTFEPNIFQNKRFVNLISHGPSTVR